MTSSKRRFQWLAIAAALIVGRGALSAQTRSAPHRVWSVSVSGGTPAFAKSSQDVEGAMRAGGFDNRADCSFFCDGTVAFPKSSSGDGVMLTIRRRFGRQTHARAVFGRTTLAETQGFKPGLGFGSYVFLRQAVTTVALMAGMDASADDGFWAAAGPALHRTALEQTQLSSGGVDETATRLGAVVAAGLMWPARKRLFVELQGQYRLAGAMDVPPIDIVGFNDSIIGTIPATSVNFNHGMLTLGVGARF